MQSNHNYQKKIAVINDLSGFGRCSLTVSLPVISALGVQCCPLPTSVFSNHTGYPSFFFRDCTEDMPAFMDEWKKLELQFSGIATGFLGSAEQIDLVERFFREFRSKDTVIVVDPVMGDYGSPYPTYTAAMCEKMRQLLRYADILTPNLTEVCLLTDTPYHEGKWRLRDIQAMAEKLAAMGPKKLVITGLPQGEFIANYCYETGKEARVLRTHRVGTSRSGTGDLFAAIIAADAVNQIDFQRSVRRASRFIKRCILASIERDIPPADGVCFEDILYLLRKS